MVRITLTVTVLSIINSNTRIAPGPIVRINPDEIHISAPDFYDTVYAGSGRKRDKWDWITKSFGVDESLIGTLPHDVHRIRRASLAPFFSKASVRALQPLVEKELAVMMKRLRGFQDSREPLTLNIAFAAFTNGRHTPSDT